MRSGISGTNKPAAMRIMMPFVKITGLNGKLYVPEEKTGTPKKHNCRDCFACQMCTDDRCQVCRQKQRKTCKKPKKHNRTNQ